MTSAPLRFKIRKKNETIGENIAILCTRNLHLPRAVIRTGKAEPVRAAAKERDFEMFLSVLVKILFL